MKPQDVRCPHCGAKPGEKCFGGTLALHQARYQKMLAAERKLARAKKTKRH